MVKIEIIDNNNNTNTKSFNGIQELKAYLEKEYNIDEWDYTHLINFGYCTHPDFNIKIIPK